ncbi:tetratricopeptide repeat protein [Streptomyces lydicus]|uniref:tetratricopeptide repeat protein n=1 Tax=Streptomyces lydicus TaxID=47763 RepID=UPI0036FC2EC7
MCRAVARRCRVGRSASGTGPGTWPRLLGRQADAGRRGWLCGAGWWHPGDHHQTLTSQTNFGRWLAEVGDAVGAAAVFVRLLADTQRVLGSDHPDAFATRAALTGLRREGEIVDDPAAYEWGAA